MPSFHSTMVVLKHEDIFFIRVIIHILGTAILSRINVDCVFLASTLNTILVLFEVLSQYLAAGIIRGVYKTLSNMMELFVKIRNGF